VVLRGFRLRGFARLNVSLLFVLTVSEVELFSSCLVLLKVLFAAFDS
jgi:hypothetical protein